VPELIIDQFPGSFALFLQGLVYPFAALLRLTTGADASTPLLLSLAAVVILPLIFWVSWRSPGRVLIATFGIIWYVLTSLPATLLLETEYVLGSWRLLLLSSVGAAIFWGAMLAEMWSRPEANHHRQRIKAAIAIGIGVLGLLVSLDFLGRRRDDALLQSSYTWALQDQIREHTSGDPLVINAPSFLASLDENRLFPTVGTGVMFMENYVNYAQQFWAQTGEDFPRIEAAAFYPVLTPPSNLVFAPYLTVSPDSPVTDHLLRATDIYVTTFTERVFYPVYVGGPGLPGSDIAIATFPGAGLILTEAEAELTSNTLVTLRTRWHVETPLPVRPVVDVRCDGVAVGLSTGAVWGGTHPFSVWKPGEIETDRREIPLIQAVTVDCLQILIGIFNEADGDSVPVFTPNSDTPLPDHRLPVALSSGT
jgi:hypothetical protein